MNLSRRNFIGAGVAFAGCRVVFGNAGAQPNLKVGVLSDVHLHPKALWNTSTPEMLAKTLAWFRDRDVDAVAVAGDMTENGLVEQLELFAKTWFSVFPDDRGRDGRKVERVFVYGNHDVADWMWSKYKTDDERRQKVVCCDMAGHWERIFHEPFRPAYVKMVKGYAFFGGHWPIKEGMKGYHFTGLPWPIMSEAAAFVSAEAPKLDPRKPFFYVQHAHPCGTCYGDWAWGHDDGTITRALSRFPQAIALSGHSHYSLTDERSVWQGAFTSIGTSSLAYTSTDYNFRENANANNYGSAGNRRPTMSRVPTGDGNQGMLFTVYDDHLRIERRDFHCDEPLGPDWILPLGKGTGGSPFAFAPRAAARKAPEFPADARVTVARVDERDEKKRRVRVSFPFARTVDGCRVFEYEVRAFLMEDDVAGLPLATRRALAPDFFLPLSRAGKDGAVDFTFDDIPAKARVQFEVRPIECFGKKGKAILSEVWK